MPIPAASMRCSVCRGTRIGPMRILWAVCGWGLGHATRSLPVLRRLVCEHDVVVYAEGAAAALLSAELPGRIRLVPAVLYPNIFGGRALPVRFFRRAPALVRPLPAAHAQVGPLVGAARSRRGRSDPPRGA